MVRLLAWVTERVRREGAFAVGICQLRERASVSRECEESLLAANGRGFDLLLEYSLSSFFQVLPDRADNFQGRLRPPVVLRKCEAARARRQMATNSVRIDGDQEMLARK